MAQLWETPDRKLCWLTWNRSHLTAWTGCHKNSDSTRRLSYNSGPETSDHRFFFHVMFKGSSRKEARYLSSPVYRCLVDQIVTYTNMVQTSSRCFDDIFAGKINFYRRNRKTESLKWSQFCFLGTLYSFEELNIGTILSFSQLTIFPFLSRLLNCNFTS